jgi:hypothetical protein
VVAFSTVTPGRSRAIRHGLFLAGLAVLAWILYGAWLGASDASVGEAYDAHTYWAAARGEMYARPVLGGEAAYYYSPAFLQLLAPVLALPFHAFLGLWYSLTGAALAWVARWWLPVALLTGFVGIELIRGNIEPLMAVAVVVGMRHPAAWAFILLTKVTPGVGLVWFAARREWRSLAIALGATVAVAAVSFVVAPGLWFEWIRSLVDNTGVNIDWAYFPIPLAVRLPIAAAIVWFGARRGWAWIVPVGATLAMPALWPVNMTLLVAVVPLLGSQREPLLVVRATPPTGADAGLAAGPRAHRGAC